MKKIAQLAVALTIAGTSMSAAAEKLSFPHAAELTDQAKTIVWQEVAASGIPNSQHQQMVCLAENIYFEARAESIEGKAAVANVTRNRVNSDRFPNTYCEVAQAGYKPGKIGGCAFSWYCDGKKDVIWANYERTGETIAGNAKAWRQSVEVAIWTLGYGSYRVNDNTKGATHYYAHNLMPDEGPWWAKKLTFTAVVGNHTFMK